MTQRWISKFEVGNADVVLQALRTHGGIMLSGNLMKEIGVDRRTFMGYLNTLKRIGLIRFSDLFPYEDTFHIRIVE